MTLSGGEAEKFLISDSSPPALAYAGLMRACLAAESSETPVLLQEGENPLIQPAQRHCKHIRRELVMILFLLVVRQLFGLAKPASE